MSKKVSRYHNEIIINHLASHYVLGLLSTRVAARVKCLQEHNPQLSQQIMAWQSELSWFDRHGEELIPSPETWQKIQKNSRDSIKKSPSKAKKNRGIVLIILALYLLWIML